MAERNLKTSFGLSELICLCSALFFPGTSACQVGNDDCTNPETILVWQTVPCTFQWGGPEVNHWIGDSTNNATIGFPYPSNPNFCTGYTSTIGPPGRDVWYHPGHTANRYMWE